MNIIKKFYCYFFDEHEPIQGLSLDNYGLESICKHCGKHIIQDVQGRWFERK